VPTAVLTGGVLNTSRPAALMDVLVTADDGVGTASAFTARRTGFNIGPPTCNILSPLSGVQSGNITFTFDVDDPDLDPAGPLCFYDTGSGWTLATMTVPPHDTTQEVWIGDVNRWLGTELPAVTSPPAAPFSFIWVSTVDLPVFVGYAWFGIGIWDGLDSDGCYVLVDLNN
jgi:hypothetical protein